MFNRGLSFGRNALCSAAEPRSASTALEDNAAGWRWLFRNRTSASTPSLFASDEDDGNVVRRTRKMARLEAVLLVADGAMTFRKLAQLATLADAAEARALVEKLNAAYDEVSCAFRVERVATGVRLMTRPRFAMWLDRLHNRQARQKLSQSMMETLAIVAYRQPITRAEVEKIRGVASAEMLKQLMERSLVRITGEEDSLGRPFLYGTSRQFLEEFGLGSLDDMPMSENLRRQDKPEEEEEAPDDAAAGVGDESGTAEDESTAGEEESPNDLGLTI